MKNPRNCLVADISDRWTVGRKGRHGPTQCPFFFLKNAENFHCLVSVCAVWAVGTATVQYKQVSFYTISFFVRLLSNETWKFTPRFELTR